MNRAIKCVLSVYLPMDSTEELDAIADEITSGLFQHNAKLFETVIVDDIDEKIGSPQREILSAVIDFDNLRKTMVDKYNGIINEMRMYYQNNKSRKKTKSDLYGVFLILEELKESIVWLLRCDNQLTIEMKRLKDAYFFAEPSEETKEKEQSK